MNKRMLIGVICVIYLFIISLIFGITSLNAGYLNKDYGNVSLIDISNNQLVNKNKEIIDKYVDIYDNNDVVGEIKIINSNYKKAIMQSDNNDYYLNHLENKTSSYMGSIYLDFRIDIDNDKKLLIYGHNSATIDMPFKILENYYNKKYYNSHKYIQITTRNKTRMYEIYSILVATSDFNYMKTEFKNNEQWYEHIKNFKNKSMYDTGVTVEKNDNILILQTCSTHSEYNNYSKKYLLIVAKEIDN